LTAPINENSVVIDLGLNSGAFSREIIRRFGCRVIGVEPVPSLFAALPAEERLVAEARAITADGSGVVLHLNRTKCATILHELTEDGSEEVEVAGTTIQDLLDRHDIRRAALAKVDIEGAELAMITAMTQSTAQRFDQFTIEFHDFLNSDQRPAVRQAKQRLKSFGFWCVGFSRGNSADVLFINEEMCPLSWSTRALVIARYKYARGAVRVFNRL
jgi:FkbM family methyltransferase